jgi:hypothetical protein
MATQYDLRTYPAGIMSLTLEQMLRCIEAVICFAGDDAPTHDQEDAALNKIVADRWKYVKSHPVSQDAWRSLGLICMTINRVRTAKPVLQRWLQFIVGDDDVEVSWEYEPGNFVSWKFNLYSHEATMAWGGLTLKSDTAQFVADLLWTPLLEAGN